MYDILHTVCITLRNSIFGRTWGKHGLIHERREKAIIDYIHGSTTCNKHLMSQTLPVKQIAGFWVFHCDIKGVSLLKKDQAFKKT